MTAPPMLTRRRVAGASVTPPALPQVESVPTPAEAFVDVHVTALLDQYRNPVVRDYRLVARPGSVTLLSAQGPAARWALAHLLAGRLSPDRYTFRGHVRVAGHHSPTALRAMVGLATPWRVRGADDGLQRRLRSLDWAEASAKPVVVLSPGFDGLGSHQFDVLSAKAHRLAATGAAVIVTAPAAANSRALPAYAEALGTITNE